MLSIAAYSGMFVFGIVMALLGAILPALAGQLRFAVADIGTLFLIMNFAMLVCSLLLGLAMDRFGMKPPLALGPLLVAAALVVIIRAQAFPDLFPAVALLGVGGGAVNGAANTLVADLHDDPQKKNAALNLVGVFFGLGALFLPFAMGALLAKFSLATLLGAAAILCAAAGIYSLVLRYPPPKQAHRLPIADMSRFLRSPLVLIFAVLLFFESGVEFTLGGFISTYLTRDMAISSVSMASWILAGYWAAVILSRIVLSRIALGANPYRILFICSVGACLGATVAAIAPMAGMAAFGIWLTGWALAGIYPAVLGIAGARFQSHSGTVFGILFAIALTGGMIIPWVSGQVAALAGLRWVFGLVAGCFAAIVLLGRLALARTGSWDAPRVPGVPKG
jgi:MFS transporter, FHS family, glucose/mannose:H+ symporter